MGDSLVFSSETSGLKGTESWITDEIVAGGNQANVTGWIGATVNYTYLNLWNHPSRQGVTPDVLVVALGTNDMKVDPLSGLPPTTPEAAALVLGAWLAEVPDACALGRCCRVCHRLGPRHHGPGMERHAGRNSLGACRRGVRRMGASPGMDRRRCLSAPDSRWESCLPGPPGLGRNELSGVTLSPSGRSERTLTSC
ncbi:MAG: SGNH/GDSL hydrolase family protein [Acidimicrobiales bacterium]